MELLNVIRALQARSYSFKQLKSELKQKEMLSAKVNGWSGLLRIYAEYQTSGSKDLPLWQENLTNIFTNHVRYGMKAIVIFPIEHDVALRLIDKMEMLSYNDSPFRSSYPLPLRTDKLRNVSSDSIPTSFELEDAKTRRLVICTRRAIKTRDSFQYDQVSEHVRNDLKEDDEDKFERVIVVRNRIVQSFDSVLIRPTENRLEIHVDIPEYLGVEEVLKTINTHTEKITTLLKGISNANLEPVNFFPCIARLYKEPQGSVHQLGHTTGSESVKNERMRKKDFDLREEIFHQKGLEALGGSTNLYSITKAWASSNGIAYPQLSIIGYVSDAEKINAVVNHAIVDGYNCKEDFERLITKLV